MLNEDMLLRLRRIYAAIGETVETDVRSLAPKAHVVNGRTYLLQDFSGGKSVAQMKNLIESTVANIASFRDHMRRWLEKVGRSQGLANSTVDRSFELRVMVDLHNFEKHGEYNGEGRSKRQPRRLAGKCGFCLALGLYMG